MNKTFKKIAASVMAVTSLVVSMTSFSTSAAAEPRVGGSRTFSVGSYCTATATIDRTTTFGYATTNIATRYTSITSVTAMVTARSTVDGALTDIDTITGPGKAIAQKYVTNCYDADSTHSSMYNNTRYSTEMSA